MQTKDLFTAGVMEEEERSEQLDRSMFSVLRRGEMMEAEHEEVERREDEVEDRLEGWREGHEKGRAATFDNREHGWSVSVEF